MPHTAVPPPSCDAIQRQLQQLLQRVVPLDDEGLLSITLDISLPYSEGGLPELAAPYFSWEEPRQGRALLGIGEAALVKAHGSERFRDLHREFEVLQRHWRRIAADHLQPFAAAFVGIAFDADDPMTGEWRGFPNSLIHLPSLLLHRQQGGTTTLTFSCRQSQLRTPEGQLQRWRGELEGLLSALATPRQPAVQTTGWCGEESPSREVWLAEVERATGDIQDGVLSKVVCARRRTLQTSRPLSALPLLTTLRQRYPECYQIAMNLTGTPLVAATPERLVQLREGQLQCDALGGSAPRAAVEASDRLLSQGLQHNPKTRQEHRLVVDYIRDALTPFCRELDVPDSPELLQLRNIQHLRTRISGQVQEGSTLLELAATLHPTPAVCGVPLVQAQQWLQQHEPLRRGWYSGAVGWLGADGDGELNVLLRCALLQGTQATLYAGAGVVADSVPQEEWEETELKLEALFDALQLPTAQRPAAAASQ